MDLRDMIGLQLVVWCLTLLMGVVLSQLTIDNTEGGEFCFLDPFEANCTGRGFILMINAQYGRMKTGNCIQDSNVQIGCYTNVIDYIDRKCSGRETCSLPVTQLASISTGCSQDVLSYLDAIYTCADASVGNQDSCNTDQTTYLTGHSGYISSTALQSNFFGTTQCTFTVTVLPGQTVDFSIYDFTLKDAGATPSTMGTGPSCPVGIVFTENRETNTKSLCNGSLRQRFLYGSDAHQVVVHFTLENPNTDVPLFFISYQATGCAHYKAPVNTSVEMEEGYATVTCNFTGDAWTFQCDNTQWVLQDGNTIENCTREIAAERNKKNEKTDDEFPWGILIAVGIGIALGTVVGLFLLSLVFLCRRCCCPDNREPLRSPETARSQVASEHVPPMGELITEASLLAKQAPPVRRPDSYHYAPHQFGMKGPVSQTVAASIEYNPAGPQPLAMMNLDMRNRAAATLPRPRSLDSVSDHIYETYKHRTDSGSMISESSSAEQLQTLGVSVTPSIAMATLPLRVPPPPVAPKPSFPRQSSVPASEASTSTSHPVAGEETVVDKL